MPLYTPVIDITGTGSGTPNAIAKFIGTDTVGDSLITDTGSAVVIAATTSTAGLTNTGALVESGIINAGTVSGTNHNWTPTGFTASTRVIYYDGSNTTITGLTGGVERMYCCRSACICS